MTPPNPSRQTAAENPKRAARVAAVLLLLPASFSSAQVFPAQPKLELVLQTGHMGKINAVAFSPDGQLVATASEDKTVKIWDAATGAERRTLRGHAAAIEAEIATRFKGSPPCTPWPDCMGGRQHGVLALAFSPDGRLLTSVSTRRIIVSEVSTGREVRSFAGPALGSPAVVAVSADGRWVAGQDYKNREPRQPGQPGITLWDVESGSEVRTFAGQPFGFFSLAFSPDSRLLAGGKSDGIIQLWETATGSELRTLARHQTEVQILAFNHDGSLIATAGREYQIKVWETGTGRIRSRYEGYVGAMGFSPDGRLLAMSVSGNIELWDVAAGQRLHSLKHERGGTAVAFSPDSGRLAMGGGDGVVEFWDTATGRQLGALGSAVRGIHAVAFSPDAKLVALVTGDNTIRLWDVATQRELRSLAGHSGRVGAVAFTPDSSLLISGGGDGLVKVWEAATGREVRSLVAAVPREVVERQMEVVEGRLTPRGESRRSLPVPVLDLAISADGRRLACATYARVKVWDMATGQEVRSITSFPDDGGFRSGISSVTLSADGRWLATVGREEKRNQVIKLWEVVTGREVPVPQAEYVIGLAFSADGRLLIASSSRSGRVTVRDAASGQEESALAPVKRLGRGTAFSPDGRWVFSGGLRETATGRELGHLSGHRGSVNDVAFSPDGRWLASVGQDNTFKLWEMPAAELSRATAGHTAPVGSLAFSPDGRLLASGSMDQTIGIWEVDSGRLRRFLAGHDGPIPAVAFGPDGQRLVSWSRDNMKLWDVAAGREVRSIEAGGLSVAFSPDGRRLAVGGGPRVRVSDVETGSEVRVFTGFTEPVKEPQSRGHFDFPFLPPGPVALGPEGRWLAAELPENADARALQLWDVRTGRLLRTLLRIQSWSAYFSKEIATRRLSRTTSVAEDSMEMISALASSADGRLLAAAVSKAGDPEALQTGQVTIRWWETATGRELHSITIPVAQVSALAFSPDGRWLAGGSSGIMLWEVATGREVRTLPGHPAGVSAIAFSPDGRLLASAGSAESTVKLWEVETGRELHALPSTTGAIPKDSPLKLEERDGPASEAPAASSPQVRVPRLVHRVEPHYTEEAKKSRVQGVVVLMADVTPTGDVENVQVKQGLHPGLDENAVKAVRQWKFEPGMRDGKPVRLSLQITLEFRLK